MMKLLGRSLLVATALLCIGATAWAKPALKVTYPEHTYESLYIKYPQVQIERKGYVSNKINWYFKNEAEKSEHRFILAKEAGGVNTTEIKHEESYYGDKYICFVNKGYDYPQGAAHPLSWKNGITFDLRTGGLVKNWQELLSETDNKETNLTNINKWILAHTKAKGNVLYADFKGLKELPSNYYLDKEGQLIFIFGQYEIAPYASGILEVPTGKYCK